MSNRIGCDNVNNTVPVRSDIPVSEFPDYVLDMTVENQHDTSKLALEYQVGSIHTRDHGIKRSFKMSSISAATQ